LISQLKQITVEYHDQYTANSCPHNGGDIATEVKCDTIEDSYQRQKAAIIGQVFERKDLPETKTFAAIRANLAATKTSVTALSVQRQQKNLQAISNAVGAGNISAVVGKLKDYIESHGDNTAEATVLNCTSTASGAKGGAKDSVPCNLRLLPTATANQLGFIITTQEAMQLGVYDLEHAMITMVTFENNNIMQLIVRNKLLAPDLLKTNLYHHQFSPATLTSYYQEFFKQSFAPLRYLTEPSEFPAKIQLIIQSLTALHKQPVQMMAETVNEEVRSAVSPKVRAIPKCNGCWLNPTGKKEYQYPHIDKVKNTLKQYAYYDGERFVYTIDKFAIAVEAMSDQNAPALQLGTISVTKDNRTQYNPLGHIATNQDINHILRIAMQEAAELSQMTERAIRKQYFLVSDTNIGRSAIFAYRLRQTLYQKGLLVDKDGHILCRVKSAASYQPAEKSWLAHIVNFLVPSAMAEGGDGNDNNESECEDKENTIWDENESECEAECLQLGMGLNDLVSFEKYFLQTLANVPNQQEQFNVTQVFPQNMPQLSDIQQMFAVSLSDILSKRINPDGSLDVISVIVYFLGEWGLLARIQLGIYKPEVMQDLFIMIDGILEINFEDTNKGQKEQIYALRLELAKQILQQLRGPNIDIWTDPKYKPLITLLSQFAEPKAQEFVDQEDRNLLILLQLAVALDKLETDIQIDDQLEILNLIIDQLVNDQPLTSEQTALLTHLLDVHNPLKRRPDSTLNNAQISILQENILPSVTEALDYILRNRLSPEDLVAVIEALYAESHLSLDTQASLLGALLIDWSESNNQPVNEILQLFSVSTEMPSLSEHGLEIIEFMFANNDLIILFDRLFRNMEKRHMAAIYLLMNDHYASIDKKSDPKTENTREKIGHQLQAIFSGAQAPSGLNEAEKAIHKYFAKRNFFGEASLEKFKDPYRQLPNQVKIYITIFALMYGDAAIDSLIYWHNFGFDFFQNDNSHKSNHFRLRREGDYGIPANAFLLLLFMADDHTLITNDSKMIELFNKLQKDAHLKKTSIFDPTPERPVTMEINELAEGKKEIKLIINENKQKKFDAYQKQTFGAQQTLGEILVTKILTKDTNPLIPSSGMTVVPNELRRPLWKYIFGPPEYRASARRDLEGMVDSPWQQPALDWGQIAHHINNNDQLNLGDNFTGAYEAGQYRQAVEDYFHSQDGDHQIGNEKEDDNQIKDKVDNQKDGEQNLNWMTDEAVRQLMYALNTGQTTILEYQAPVLDPQGNTVFFGNRYLFDRDQTGEHVWGGTTAADRQGLTTLFDTITNQQERVQSISVFYNHNRTRRALVWTDGIFFQMIAQEMRDGDWQTQFYDSPPTAGLTIENARRIEVINHNGSCGAGAAVLTSEFLINGADQTIFSWLDNPNWELSIWEPSLDKE